MLSGTVSRDERYLEFESAGSVDENDEMQKAELRRRMYERIAHGNALTEAEENAHRKWHSK